MLDSTIKARFSSLIAVKMTERRKNFVSELRQIDARASVRGMLNSSNRIHEIFQAHERELDIRAILGWQSLVRVHGALGQPVNTSLRDDLKNEMLHHLREVMSELADSYDKCTKNSRLHSTFSLEGSLQNVIIKHDVEVDLYVDSLSNNSESFNKMTQNYNFYGSVGAVQTGSSATANVVQNLGTTDLSSLTSAIEQVREALLDAQNLGAEQQKELIEIADDCASQLSSETPNNTKLLTLFNTLGTAIQSISSAQPAYQALKAAVLPLGLTLP